MTIMNLNGQSKREKAKAIEVMLSLESVIIQREISKVGLSREDGDAITQIRRIDLLYRHGAINATYSQVLHDLEISPKLRGAFQERNEVNPKLHAATTRLIDDKTYRTNMTSEYEVTFKQILDKY